ncbi:MAG: hypothetical protein SNG14_01235 [Rikenellaceae bacterium]
MSLLILILGAISGSFFAALVGLIGSNRRIGFGWAFLLSLIFTPLIGLIITLFSDPLPYGAESRWGCLGALLGVVGLLCLIPFIMALMGLSLAFML